MSFSFDLLVANICVINLILIYLSTLNLLFANVLCSRGFKVVTTNYIFCDTKQTAKNKLYLLYHLVFR